MVCQVVVMVQSTFVERPRQGLYLHNEYGLLLLVLLYIVLQVPFEHLLVTILLSLPRPL